MPLQRWVCFDTETTDLVGNLLLPLSKQPRIVEFGAVLFSMDEEGHGEELETLDFMCNPGVPMAPKAAQITGITNAELRQHPPITGHLPAIADLMAKAEHRVGHNLGFDESMLDFECMRHGASWRPAAQVRWDTVEATEHLQGYRLSLAALYARLHNGETFQEAHRALNDVRATVAVVRALRARGYL
jgi:DNA polymerase III epsilon subunit-like protein